MAFPSGLEAFVKDIEPVVEDQLLEQDSVDITTEDTNNEVVQTTEIEQDDSQEGEGDYVKEFLEGIGYDGEPVKGNTLNDLITAAKFNTDKYKEKAEFYESNETLKNLAEHIKLGGDPREFFSQPQESNIYQEIVLEEDDVETREEIFLRAYSDRLEKEEIEILIERSKEKGTFNADSQKLLDKLKVQETEYNNNLQIEREKERQEAIEQRKTFHSELEKGFTEGLTGITVDKAIVDKAKTLSNPDSKGNYGINDIINSLTPRQEAVLNTFIIAMVEKKAFQFTPTKAVVTGFKEKPVHQLLGKTSGSGNSEVIREDAGQVLNTILQKLKNNN